MYIKGIVPFIYTQQQYHLYDGTINQNLLETMFEECL